MRCSLACSSCQLLKWSKIANSATVAEERKNKGDYTTVYYCALFYLLKLRTSYLQLSGSLMLLACLISFMTYRAMATYKLFVLFNKGVKIVNGDITHAFVLR